MLLRDLFILLPLLVLAMAQGEDTNKAGVVVMEREELTEELTKIIAAVLPKSEVCATIEDVTSIVQDETDKLFHKVEALIKPIEEKLFPQKGLSPSQPAISCKEIIELEPKSPSGFYWLRASNGSAVRIFCDMTRTCGGVTGGWWKVAELNMTNTTNQCPATLDTQTRSGKRLCARGVAEAGCSSVNYPTMGISYSEVCGKVIGYQFASTDGARTGGSIDGPYIDGVSLTHGNPRQHIWTFISAITGGRGHSVATCYCTNRNDRGPLPPSFVGQDYFCDSGNRKWIPGSRYFYDSPLWDGAGCGPTNECCTFRNPPWFYKSLAQDTSDDIEMRVCRNQDARDEDVLIQKVDIFVR